ncbi:DUF2516 family protein [Corynebacterium sp. H127]|uniref:DUF2516 family protein n=1 Tax=Corynebacterium sp. H127 TaxID=3133418 RepID=UPI00403F9F45
MFQNISIMTSIIMYAHYALTLCALFGAVQVAMTREDAFPAADRQSKWMWFGILIGCAFAIVAGLPILSWIAIVAVGVYFFDVRPQIKDLISGNYRW